MIEWANNPPEWYYSRYASSEEELADLRIQSIEGRQSFLLNAAHLEIARRAVLEASGGDIPTHEIAIEFSAPKRETMTLRDCETIGAIHHYHSVMSGTRPSWDADTLKRYWRNLAQDFAYMNGYDKDTQKFSDVMFKPGNRSYRPTAVESVAIGEENFQHRLSFIERYDEAGFSARFLTDGILKIEDACLDIASIESMLGARKNDGRDGIFYHYGGVELWQQAVAAKREFDSEGPNAGKTSYFDSIDEIGPGVFAAPYIDPAVIRSRRYVSIDDWQRGSLATDASHSMSKLVRGFNEAVALASTGNRYAQHPYYSERDPLNAHSAVFFDRSHLQAVISSLDLEKTGRYIVDIAEHLMRETSAETVKIDDTSLEIRFGTSRISKLAAEVIGHMSPDSYLPRR